MRAAPAFELTSSNAAIERFLLALLAAVASAAFAAWLWSHIDARAGFGVAWTWPVVVAVAAGLGGWIGWAMAVPRPCTLRWHRGRWTWVDAQSGIETVGTAEVRLDLGSWMLLALRPSDGAVRWAAIGRQRAGAAWHPLRSTLFAPPRRATEPRAGESAPK